MANFTWIVFEGVDASGKTSCARFTTNQLIKNNVSVQFVAEPALDIDNELKHGISEQYLQYNKGWRREIRSLLKTQDHLDDSDKLTLFLIDRCVLLQYLKENSCDIVCQDRSYISTLVYQSVYLDLPIDYLMVLNKAVFTSVFDIRPDIIFYLKTSFVEAERRCMSRVQDMLDVKAMDKLNILVERYDWLLGQQQLKNIDDKFDGQIVTINTNGKTLNAVKTEIFAYVQELIRC